MALGGQVFDLAFGVSGCTFILVADLIIQDLGYGPDEQEQAEIDALEAMEAAEEAMDEEVTDDLDPEMADFLDQLIKRTILFCEELWGKEFRPYQRTMSYRVIESLMPQRRRGDHRPDGPPVRQVRGRRHHPGRGA